MNNNIEKKRSRGRKRSGLVANKPFSIALHTILSEKQIANSVLEKLAGLGNGVVGKLLKSGNPTLDTAYAIEDALNLSRGSLCAPQRVVALDSRVENKRSSPEIGSPVELSCQPEFNAFRWNRDVNIAPSAHAFRVVGEAAADETKGSRAGYFGENDYTIWDDVEIPDTTRFVRIIGESMSPVLLGGQYAMVGDECIGRATPGDRDIVVAEVRIQDDEQNEADRPWEGVYCKRVINEGDLWLFTSINPIGTPFTILKSHCRVWPVIGIWFAGKGKPPEED